MSSDLSKKVDDSSFKSIIQSSPMGVHVYKLEESDRLVFKNYNPAADTILQTNNSEYVGKTIEVAFPNLSTTEIPDRYREVCRKGVSYHLPEVIYKDGIIDGIFEVFAFQTAPYEMATLFRDITEYKLARDKIKEHETFIKFKKD